ncbi:MAG: transglutaminase domain-containing protein [Ruminococcus sp.]|nr:transglutaminase domain-containing protein [Ruminococcus sp.]
MKSIALYFKNRICLWLLPLLLTSVAGSVLIECYAQEYKTPFTLLYFFYALLTFALLDALMRIRHFGGLIYIAVIAAVGFLSLRSVFSAEYYGRASMSFQQWFYGNFQMDQGIEWSYFIPLFVAGGLFLNSVIFYFTQVQYRAFGTLLILFVPFVIYAKRDDVMSDLKVTVLITLFIAVIVHNRIFLAADKGNGTKLNAAYVLSVSLFVTVTGALAMIFPDLSSPSRLEKDASFLNFTGINASNGAGFDNPDSSSRFHGVQYTNEPMFYVYPEDFSDMEYPIYLRRRSMNAYDAEKLDWYVSSDLKKEQDTLVDTLDVSFSELYKAESNLGRRGLLGASPEAFEKSYAQKTFDFEIEFENSVGGISYAPFTLYSSVERGDDADDTFSVPMAYSDFHYIYPTASPTEIGRLFETSVKQSTDAAEFARLAGGSFADFKRDMENAYLEDADSVLDENGEPTEDKLFEYHIGTNYDAYYGYVDRYYHYSPTYLDDNGIKDYDRIKELADSIVKDCDSDYEKAKAIEQYFTNEGFTYDLEYIPEDESVSYFLFESKTGICIDFASAMGVMLIMEDIPVRYVEGFAAYERDAEDPSRLVVRDSHAHAYIEAFIPYVGWMTFDPTVAGYMQDFSGGNEEESEPVIAVFLRYLGRVLLVLGVLFVLVFVVFFDRIWEVFFRLSLRLYDCEKKLIKLHRHIFKLLEYEDKTDLAPYTSNLLNDYLRRKTGSSLTEVTDLFEQNRFGAKPITEEQFEKAYSAYKALYPQIRKKATHSASAE